MTTLNEALYYASQMCGGADVRRGVYVAPNRVWGHGDNGIYRAVAAVPWNLLEKCFPEHTAAGIFRLEPKARPSKKTIKHAPHTGDDFDGFYAVGTWWTPANAVCEQEQLERCFKTRPTHYPIDGEEWARMMRSKYPKLSVSFLEGTSWKKHPRKVVEFARGKFGGEKQLVAIPVTEHHTRFVLCKELDLDGWTHYGWRFFVDLTAYPKYMVVPKEIAVTVSGVFYRHGKHRWLLYHPDEQQIDNAMLGENIECPAYAIVDAK